MAIEIPTEFFPSVKAAIARGAYASEHDVVTHALRLWQRHEELASKIQEGIEPLNRGEGISVQSTEYKVPSIALLSAH